MFENGMVRGIDVGFSDRRATTGLCTLSWTPDSICWCCCNERTGEAGRRTLHKALLGGQGSEVLAVAIDGPLRPRLRVEYTYRACEAVLSRVVFQRRGKPGPSTSTVGMLLHKEATTLAHLTFQACSMGGATWRPSIHETAVAEAFPNAFLAALCDEDDFPAKPAKSRKWTDELFPRVRDKCMAIVRALLPNREVIDENVCKCNFSNHEHVAAFVCALSALSVLANEAVLVGASDDGDIVLPPLRFWGWNAERTVPWAETALKTNVASCRLKFPNARVLDLAGGKTIA